MPARQCCWSDKRLAAAALRPYSLPHPCTQSVQSPASHTHSARSQLSSATHSTAEVCNVMPTWRRSHIRRGRAAAGDGSGVRLLIWATLIMTGSGYFASSSRPLRETRLVLEVPPVGPAPLGNPESLAASKHTHPSCRSTSQAAKQAGARSDFPSRTVMGQHKDTNQPQRQKERAGGGSHVNVVAGVAWLDARPESMLLTPIPESTTRPRELVEPPPITRGGGGAGTSGGLSTYKCSVHA